jgi:hypothetical protein
VAAVTADSSQAKATEGAVASGAAGQSGPLARYNCGSGGARRVSLGQDSGRFPFSIKFGNPVPAGSIASVWKRERVQLHACSCMRACTQLVHYCCCGCSLPLLAATAAVPLLVAAVSAVATCSVLADVQCSLLVAAGALVLSIPILYFLPLLNLL